VPVGKALGRRRVREALLGAVDERIPAERGRLRFGIVHVGCPEIVGPLRDELRRRYGEVEVLSAPATPVIATHLGIGAWGIAWTAEE
jgi:fatty acid-binding protein DegV